MPYKISDSCQIPNLNDVYEKYFASKTDGYFCEIGGYDGISFSNTWGLAEASWQGLYVEPIAELADRCRETHKNNRVVTIECAISDTEGLTDIWLGPDLNFPSSTIDESSMQAAALEVPDFGYSPDRRRTVRTLRLDTLLSMLGTPVGFDLLVIDVEGAELKVLAGFSWEKWLPKMIIIEDHDGNVYKSKALHTEAIAAWFSNTPYVRFWHDATNSIYVLEAK
jgi:FkbM family methyltransferase